jgi:hypothetical protein
MSTAGERLAFIADPNGPVDLATHPDGTVYWIGDRGRGSRAPNGSVPSPVNGYDGYTIAVAADGRLVYTERQPIPFGGRQGFVCISATTAPGSCNANGDTRHTGLALDATGRMWAAAYELNVLRRFQPSPLSFDLPVRIALGPDGNLWVTMFDASAIDRVTPAGARTRFPLPPGTRPNDITVGPDGALWFTGYGSNTIGRMTTAGVLTNEFPIPTPASLPIGITAGADGAIWFTESATDKIGRLVLDASTPGSQGGGGGGGTVSDRTAPRFLRGPTLSPARFRVGRAPRGTSVAYTLSEAAAVTTAIERARPGRRAGGRCRRPAPANRGRPRCTRYVAVGTLRRDALQGANRVAFSGRIGGRALAAGSYRATLRARDAAGNRSPARTARFTVVSARAR